MSFIMKLILYFIVLLKINSCLSARIPEPKAAKLDLPKKNSTTFEVIAELQNADGIGGYIGVVEVGLPSVEKPLHVCFPTDQLEHVHAAIFSHVVCRQLGFMTFGSSYVESHPIGDEQFSLAPTSSGCIGNEQSLSYCPWRKMNTKQCRDILGIRCDSCFKKFIAKEGYISSPGYPNAYFYSVTCEWRIIVPEAKSIDLVFSPFLLPGWRQNLCDANFAHIEIIYQTKNGAQYDRYCSGKQVRNLTIPAKDVRIRFFSGFYKGQEKNMKRKYGISIGFKGNFNGSFARSFKPIAISSILIVLFVVATSCYLCQKWKNQRKQAEERFNSLQPNAPGREELQAAYEFQRVLIQGPNNDFLRVESSANSVERAENSLNLLPTLPTSFAPPGPRFRKVSSYSATPRTIIPEILEMREGGYNDGNRTYIDRLKKKLFARFSTTSCGSHQSSPPPQSLLDDIQEDCVFFPPPANIPFEIYRSISSEKDLTPRTTNAMSSSSIKSEYYLALEKPEKQQNSENIPSIIVHNAT